MFLKKAGNIIFLLLFVSIGHAQEFRASVSPTSGTIDDNYRLTIRSSGTEIKDIFFKSSNLFEVVAAGTGSSIQIINGVTTTDLEYFYSVGLKQTLSPGTYKLPNIVVNKLTELEGPAITIIAKSSKLENRWQSIQFVDKGKVYIGEQFNYQLSFASNVSISSVIADPIPLEGFLGFPLSSALERIRPGRWVEEFALFPKQSGTFEFPERVLQVVYFKSRAARRRGFFPPSLFGRPTSAKAYAPVASIEVMPLPPKPTGSQNYIPVGQHKITSRYLNNVIRQGEPISLEIKIEGNGNLYPLTLPELDKEGFELYEINSNVVTRVELKEVVQTKTIEAELVPYNKGTYQTPEIRIIFFDPESETYQALKIPESKITVLPDPNFSPPSEEDTQPTEDSPGVPNAEEEVQETIEQTLMLKSSSLQTATILGPLMAVLAFISIISRKSISRALISIGTSRARNLACTQLKRAKNIEQLKSIAFRYLEKVVKLRSPGSKVKTYLRESGNTKVLELANKLESACYDKDPELDQFKKEAVSVLREKL